MAILPLVMNVPCEKTPRASGLRPGCTPEDDHIDILSSTKIFDSVSFGPAAEASHIPGQDLN